MEKFEIGVLVLLGMNLFVLLDIARRMDQLARSDEETPFESDVHDQLSRLTDLVEEIEKHTGRVAKPLYDQDAFDREHLVGKYDPDKLR